MKLNDEESRRSSSRGMRRLDLIAWLGAVTVVAAAAACARSPGLAPGRLTRDPEREGFEVAVRMPRPAVTVVMALTSQYLAAGEDARGQGMFCGLAATVPDRPLFGALCGLFEIRRASEVPLLHRVAWVEHALAQMDRAAAGDGLSRYLRGTVTARLPSRFGRAAQAAGDLEWMLAHGSSFPSGLRRGAYAGLAAAYQTLGRPDGARTARDHAGLDAVGKRPDVAAADASTGAPPLATDFADDARAGLRFAARSLTQPAPGVYVARGYDFADLAFIVTDAGVVAIDAGTAPENARAALAAFRSVSAAPLRAVIVTHAHWDHVGGLSAFTGPGVEVVAQAGFADELARSNAAGVPWRYFFGDGTPAHLELHPDRLIAAPETLTYGSTRFVVQPIRGGETSDALLVRLPDRGVTFVGDAFMPYFGSPFLAEGSPEGFLDAIAVLRTFGPRQLLIHGHAPLTDALQLAALAPLGEALGVVLADANRAIEGGHTLDETLEHNLVPASLAPHPDAVFPFLLMRDNLVKRVFQQRRGYWKSDGEGIEVLSRADEAAALDLVAGGDARVVARAADALLARGDLAMALRLTDRALAAHPREPALTAARGRALAGLRARSQFNPFKLVVYSELAGASLSPPPALP